MIDFDGFIPMLYRLDQVRKSMAMAKNTKLLFKWPEKKDFADGPFQDILDALYEEFEELSEALDGPICGPSLVKIRVEIVDLVNCLEMLWDTLDLGGAW